MDEIRFSKLEKKVDQIKDDMNNLKVKSETILYMIQKHIENECSLSDLIRPLIDDFNYKKEQEKRRTATLKTIALRIGLITAFITLAMSSSNLIQFLLSILDL